jgi:hypothetical protein
MGNAYKCDLTGEIVEGVGMKVFFVQLGNMRLKIIPQRKISDRVFDQGDLSPESVRRIEAAIRFGPGISLSGVAAPAKTDAPSAPAKKEGTK